MANEQHSNRFSRAFAPSRDDAQGRRDLIAAIEGVVAAIRGLHDDGEDHCVTLFATAVDASGQCADTPLGRVLGEAGCSSLQDLARQVKKQPLAKAQEAFVSRWREAEARCKQVIDISEQDLRRFVGKVEAVARRIRAK